MKSVMKKNFGIVPKANIQRSAFDLSRGYKTTFDANYLVPFFTEEVLPGDTFNVRTTNFARLATPVAPFMDNLWLDTFFFFVPNRLVWDNWPNFNGEQANPGDTTDYLVPTLDSTAAPLSTTGFVANSLDDYFGLPTLVTGIAPISLYHRAYNLCFNEWYRDQNLIDSVVVDKGDGPDDPADYVLLKRGKRHDYFTSCLPWPQKGDAVELPLGSTAPVIGIGKQYNTWTDGVAGLDVYETGQTGTTNYPEDMLDLVNHDTNNGKFYIRQDADNLGHPAIFADLSSATAATINEIREAFQVQRLLERDARGGTRYTEIIRSHFGVISPDARLQRPEYLGGGSQMININPVAQTESSDASTPQGNLAAFGTTSKSGLGFTKSFTEHGMIIGIICVRADLTYQQGLSRKFTRSSRYDYFWPVLAHLGEQAVLMKEIYCDGTATDNTVFGYQERYAEYRHALSQITGVFRSNHATSLDYWHLSQDFDSAPTLNEAFITEDVPIDRVIAVPSEPHFLFDSHTKVKAARPVPAFGTPGLVDHF